MREDVEVPETSNSRTSCPSTCNPSTIELEALAAVARHGTIQAAANALFVSPYTINGRLDRLRNKTGLRHIPQLVAWGIAGGFITASNDEPASN